jgi:hypothetical protein
MTTPPNEVINALREGIPKFIRPNDPDFRILLQDSLRCWQFVFSLGLRDIVANKGIAASKPVGWCSLASTGLDLSVSGFITLEQTVLTELSSGPGALQAFQQTREIEHFPELVNGGYEWVVVSIPGLLVDAFWLRSQMGTPEWIVPYRTLAKELTLMKKYTVDQFLGIVRPMATAALDDEKRIKTIPHW